MAGGLEDGVNAQKTCHEAMGAARYDPDRRGYRIFVGNLSGATSHDDLANLFSPFGPIVDIWLASNPPGFGFVVFKSAGDAEKAVLDKNCTIHMGRVIKVQHARMFKDRSSRPSAVGLHDDSTSESERSKSRSRVSSRSRSRSRSSRSWSRSSSRLSFFSRIYGDSRARSRESSRSRSRSKSRSGSSFMTLSSAGSTSRSASRSRSGSSSRTKHRCSSRHHHSRRSERHERGHRHRSRRRRRRKRRRRRSQTSSGSDTSSGSRRHSGGSGASQSPYSSARPQKSSSRLEASSSRRVRRRDRCRHCRHCKKHASSASSDDSRCRYSSEEEEEAEDGEDGGGSHRKAKKRRHRRVWRRSKWSKRGSSSTSSSSSSSSSTLLSVSPKKRPPLATAEGQSSVPSEHAGVRAEGETGTAADPASSSAPPCTSLLQPDTGHGTLADPLPSSRHPVQPDTGNGTLADPPLSSRHPVQPETGHEALVDPPLSSRDPVQPETGHEALVDPPLSSRDPVQPDIGHRSPVDPPLSSCHPVQPDTRHRTPDDQPLSSRHPVQPDTGHETLADFPPSSRDPVQLDSNTAAETEPVTVLGDSTSNAATEDPSVAAVPDVDAHEEEMDTDSGVSGAERVADRRQAQLSDVGRTHIRFSLSRKSPAFSVEVSQQREKRNGTDRKPDAQDLANTCAPPPGVSAGRSTAGGAFGSGSATSRRPSSKPPPEDDSMGVTVGLEDIELPGNGTVETPIKSEGVRSDTAVSPQANLRPSAPPEDEVLSKDRTSATKSSGLAPVRSSAKHSEQDDEDACHSNTATETQREANQNGSRGETLRTIPAEKSIELPGEESLDVADSPRAGPQQERQKTRSPCLHDDVPDKAVDSSQRRPDEGHDQSTRRSRYSREPASSSHKAAHRNRDFSPRCANASKFESPRDRTSGNCYSPRRTNVTHYDFASRESAKTGSERRDREFPSVHRAVRRDDYGADFCHRSRDNFSTGFCGRSSFSARRRSKEESPSHLGWGSRHASWDRLYEQRIRDRYREDLHETTRRSSDWELSKTQSCRAYGDSTRNRTHEGLEHRHGHGHGRERREENGHEQRRAKPAECFRQSDYVPSDTCRRHSPTVPTRHSSSERRRDAAKSVPVNSSREAQTKHRDDGPKSDERRSEFTTRRRPSHSHSTSEHTGRERGRRPHRDKDPELCLNIDSERRVSPTGRRKRSRSSSGESTSARKVVRVHRSNDDESGSAVSCSKDRAHSGERSTDGGSSKTTPGSASATCARGEGQTLKAGTRHGHERQDVRTLTRETSPRKDNRDHRAASGSPEGKTRRLWRWSKSRSNENSLRASLSGRTSSTVQPSTLAEKQKSFNICQKGNSQGSEETALSSESVTARKGQSESSSMAASENSVSRKPGLLPTPKPALLPTPDLAVCGPDAEARCSAQSLPLIRSYGCSSKAVNWACSRQANGGLLDAPLRSEPARLVIRRSSDVPDEAKLKVVFSGKAGDHFKHRYSSSENSNDSSFIKTSPLLADVSKRKLLETEVRKVKLVRLCREQDSLKTLIGTSCPGHNDTRHAPTLEADDRRSNSDEKAGIKPRLRSTILLVRKPLDPFHSAKLTPPS